MALGRAYDWAGHVARFARWAPARYAHRILCYKDVAYLTRIQDMYGTQSHPHRFHAWRWEAQLSGFFGQEWNQVAVNLEEWTSHKQSWLMWRAANTQQ